eukprot:4752394-Amphidinium_carterae.2
MVRGGEDPRWRPERNRQHSNQSKVDSAGMDIHATCMWSASDILTPTPSDCGHTVLCRGPSCPPWAGRPGTPTTSH